MIGLLKVCDWSGHIFGASAMLRYGLGKPVITSEIGNWSVFVLLRWRFVFGIIMKREARAHIVRCHHDSGKIKLLLYYVS